MQGLFCGEGDANVLSYILVQNRKPGESTSLIKPFLHQRFQYTHSVFTRPLIRKQSTSCLKQSENS